jgi:hypothetical protein
MATISRRRLMRFLKLKLRTLYEQDKINEANEVIDIMNRIATGKYNINVYDQIIPSLFFIFCGMVLGFILIGILLKV